MRSAGSDAGVSSRRCCSQEPFRYRLALCRAMNTTAATSPRVPEAAASIPSVGRSMLNKVPEITLYFWIIKVLCTTVGETAADYLNDNLGLGLSRTSYVMSAVLIVALIFQFATRRYRPGIYWLSVVLISVVGTLISDNLVDGYGVPLQ